MFDHRPYVRHYGLPDRLEGSRVLDVGTWDGFWAFEMERRGAEVVAIDIDDLGDMDWPLIRRPAELDATPRGTGFNLAKEALGSRVERISRSVYEARPEDLGTFDLVLCGSLLIHLRDPVRALERMAALCRGRFVLAEEYSRRVEWVPGTRLVEFRGESPWMTWWIPSSSAWLSMVRCAGFEEARRHARFRMRFRGRWRGVPHVVIHARGSA
jgi:tRNA (mo5U34)-methyltransferase